LHPQVRWVIGWQVVLTVVVAAVVAVWSGTNAALSALVGGGIGVVANLLYVWRAMHRPVRDESEKSDPARAYRNQAAGEAYKLAATLGGFALVIVSYKDIAPIPMFVGYASTFVIYWLALARRR
jgi:ATP synthase protein I